MAFFTAQWARPATFAAIAALILTSCETPRATAPSAATASNAAAAAPAPATSRAPSATGTTDPGAADPSAVSATLTLIAPSVSVRSATGSVVPATDEAGLHTGETVRTGDGRAVITFFDGSTVELEPATELRIDEASPLPDGGTKISLTQVVGLTWHVVARLLTGSSSYEVHTQASTASVRGTAFQVGVHQQAGTPVTSIETTEGTVAAKGQDGEPVLVQAGSATTAKRGERPAQPHAAPEPDRKVTVAVADDNGLVVDPHGRANGFKDGKLVAQTPGAKVERRDGKVFVTLPNTPDGKLSTVIGRKQGATQADQVEVETTVEERGQKETTRERVQRGDKDGVGGVELGKKDGRSSLRTLDDKEKSGLRGAKVAKQPERPGRREGQQRSGEPSRSPQSSRTPEGSRTPERSRTPEGSRTPERSRPPSTPEGTRRASDSPRQEATRSPERSAPPRTGTPRPTNP